MHACHCLLSVHRESLSETIITDLANYRHKRIMGLAGMFGDHLLTRKFTHLLNYILDLYNKVARGLYSHSVINKYKKQLQKIEKKVAMEYQKAYKQG